MQASKGAKQLAKLTRTQYLSLSKRTTLFILGVLCVSAVLSASFAIIKLQRAQNALEENTTIVFNGADRWLGDNKVTAPVFTFSSSAPQLLSISPLFAQYYNSHAGVTSLGAPLTAAFPTNQGWLQFFRWGALLQPAPLATHLDANDRTLEELVNNGRKNLTTSVIKLPLLQALLSVGSQEAVADVDSRFTYVDLRKATDPALMVPASSARTGGQQATFIKGGERGGRTVGHRIPQAIWNYIQQPAISPDGWEADFGMPLTEALSLSVTRNGHRHTLLVQAFWRDGVILDVSAAANGEQDSLQRFDTSLAYLHTLGLPTVVVNTQQATWTQSDASLMQEPGMGSVLAHVGHNFPLTLLGETSWKAGLLWYHVQWSTPKNTRSGWISAAALNFNSPGDAAGWAALDTLSPTLGAYLASQGKHVGAVVYDVTHQRYYTYNNSGAQFIMGSSIKVAIMLTLLDMTERQGREPNAREMELLTTMIENSNNDSAGILYHTEIGGAVGTATFLRKIGITGLTTNADAFGWSVTTPLAMVNLLSLLYEGKILTAHDRALALYLMGHIESDQQVGVGDTAPKGATVAMKDGWVTGPDGLWTMNSSGIVTRGDETYIIAVYTQDDAGLPAGQEIARHVCGAVADLLL